MYRKRLTPSILIAVLVVVLVTVWPWGYQGGDAQNEAFPAVDIPGSVTENQDIGEPNIDNFSLGGSCDDSSISGLRSRFGDGYRVLLYGDDHSLADVAQTGMPTISYVGGRLVVCSFPFIIHLAEGQRFVQLQINPSPLTDRSSPVLIYTRDEIIADGPGETPFSFPAPTPDTVP